MHGGAAPQVQASAKERLAALVDPSLGVLGKALKSNNERIALTAAQDVLNRNGLKSADRFEHTGKDGGPIALRHSNADLLKFATDGELADVEAMLLACRERAEAATA